MLAKHMAQTPAEGVLPRGRSAHERFRTERTDSVSGVLNRVHEAHMVPPEKLVNLKRWLTDNFVAVGADGKTVFERNACSHSSGVRIVPS